MNLNKLFNIQAKLDERIIQEHGLEEQDLLDKKILALQVELGELANNWRGFKFWSKDKEPRMIKWDDDADCEFCIGRGRELFEENIPCPDCEGSGFRRYNPLLEEYVDCLHFILSIGLEKGYETHNFNISAMEGLKRTNITNQFNYLFEKIGDFNGIRNHNNYMYIVPLFIGLGEMLGFTWEQIEQAYFAKNKINHERQDNSY